MDSVQENNPLMADTVLRSLDARLRRLMEDTVLISFEAGSCWLVEYTVLISIEAGYRRLRFSSLSGPGA